MYRVLDFLARQVLVRRQCNDAVAVALANGKVTTLIE